MNKIFAVLGVIILLLLVIIIIPHNTVSNTAINTYLITLKNVPTGNGMYQQLININLPYIYGINFNGSNILFKDGSNNTFLYAWIQSINTTNLQIWVKNYNNSILIEMMILPSFENLFSANGYLGEAPNIRSNVDNGAKVFLEYISASTTPVSDFTNNSNLVYGSEYYGSLKVATLNFSNANSNFNIYPKNISIPSGSYDVLSEVYFGSSLTNVYSYSAVINPENSYADGIDTGYFTNNLGLTTSNSTVFNDLIAGNGQSNQYNVWVSSWLNVSTSTSLFSGSQPQFNTHLSSDKGSLNGSSKLTIGFQSASGIGTNNYMNILYEAAIINVSMPTFTIAPIGTAPNPLYLSNSFTISNILLMDGKVKL